MLRQAIDLEGMLTGLRHQLRRHWPLIALIYTPVAVAFAIMIIVRLRTGIPIAEFTVDPLIAAGGFPVYTGIWATVIGLIWAGTVGVLLFAWAMVRRHTRAGIDPNFCWGRPSSPPC